MTTSDPPPTVSEELGQRSAWTVRVLPWFLLAHVLAWTTMLTLTKPNPSLDLVEMVLWGHEWQLGYTKHPPLPSWIDEAVAVASGGALWAQYLAAQLAVAISFWAVWRLAREMVSPRAALLSVCLLECCPFTTFQADALNNNVGLYPCWAMAILFLYRALTPAGRIRSWAAVGLWLGLGMMTKYTTVVLAATMLGFGLLHPQARKQWRRPGPYVAMAVAMLIFLPHAWWVAAQGFAPVRYAAAHCPQGNPWLGRLWSPINFTAYQLGMLAPLGLVLIPLLGYRWRLRRVETQERFPRTFLAAMVLGPAAIHLALGVVANLELRGSYGSQLWLFSGLLLLMCLQSRVGDGHRAQHGRRAPPESVTSDPFCQTWLAWAAMTAAMLAGSAIANVASPYVLGKGSRCHFSGRLLADEVEKVWQSRYHRPLPIVAGGYFVAGTAAFFDPARPRVYESIDAPITDTTIHDCPWLGDEEFRRQGGVILWNLQESPEGIPDEVLRRFGVVESVELPPLPYQTRARVPAARIGVAIVPPRRGE